MNLTPEEAQELAELEELEQLEALERQEQAGSIKKPTTAEIKRNPGFMESLGSMLEQFSIVPPETAKDESGTIQEVRSPFESPEKEALKRGVKAAAATGTRVAGAVGGGYLLAPGGPLAMAAGATTGEEAAHQLNKMIGLEEDSGVIEDLADYGGRFALNYAGGKALDMIPGKEKIAREVVPSVPKDKLIRKELSAAQRPGITTEVQDASRRMIEGSNASADFATEVAKYEDNLLKRGKQLFGDLDPTEGVKAWEKYRNNLVKLKDSAKTTKDRVIQSGVLAEKKGASGLLPEEIDLSGLDDMITKATPLAEGAPAEALAAKEALEGIKAEADSFLFGFDQYSGRGLTKQPKLPSIEKVNSYLAQLDDRIEQLGGYDQATRIKLFTHPSVADATITGLKSLRFSVAKGLEKQTERLLGKEAAGKLTEANMDIATGIRYGELAKRFQEETGKFFTPEAAKRAVTQGQTLPSKGVTNWINKWIMRPSAVTKRAKIETLSEGLGREGDALRRLQQIESARSFTPVESRMMSATPGADAMQLGGLRAGELAISPPVAEAQSISQLGQQIYGAPVNPAKLPRSPELVLNDPQMSEYLMSQVSPDAANILQDSFNRKDPLAMEAAMTVAMQERPDLFEKSITGLASEMIRGNDIVLTDPTEAKMYQTTISSLYNQGAVDAIFLAKQTSALNTPSHRKVLPRPDLVKAPPQQQQTIQSNPVSQMADRLRTSSY